MKTFSTNQAAKKLGIDPMTLSRYIRAGKVPAPEIFAVGDSSLHGWTEEEIEHVRQLLPKIANGRKTRYKKKHSALSSGQSTKAKGKTKSKKKK
jgi:predicted site-specific integrase-resolvase